MVTGPRSETYRLLSRSRIINREAQRRCEIDVLRTDQLIMLARDRRKSLGLSQQEVAERAQVSRKWVSEFELGKAGSDFSIVLRLLSVLDLRLQVLPADQPEIEIERDASADVDLDQLLRGYSDGSRREPTTEGER